MSDRLIPSSVISDLKIEPSGNKCRIIIELSWEDLETLMAHALPNIDPAKKVKEHNDRLRAEADKRHQAQNERNLLLGKAIHDFFNELRGEGLDAKASWLETAEHFEISEFNARTFEKLYKVKAHRERDAKICIAFEKGKKVAKLCEEFNLSRPSINKILKQGGLKPTKSRGAK
ncbi:hypothetical protein [Kiloniella sp.]|uniref:hypothetical protein n=1 Tax=Kiloniella sp. TaxID=1938587 RepID=UPI003A9243B7